MKRIRKLMVAMLARTTGRWRAVLLCSGAIAMASYCLLSAAAPPEPVPQSFTFAPSASWISTTATQQATGCFRLDLSIPGTIVNAWITLASNGGFEVLVNGVSSARAFSGSPISPFQESSSQVGQRLTPSHSVIAVQIPREFQWAHHDDAELPTWVDLTGLFHPGHNALCVEVESPSTTPACILSGEVLLSTGERISIASGPDWAAEPVPLQMPQHTWTAPKSPVSGWAKARTLDWNRSYWRLVPKGAFEEPFRGKRIRVDGTGPTTWLEQSFNLPAKPLEGFLRVVTNSPFQIWLNERPIKPNTRCESAFANGSWFVREIARSPLDIAPETIAESLDPSEMATLLPGAQPQTPLRGNVGVAGNNNLDKASLYANIHNPEKVAPPVLTRPGRRMEFQIFSIGPLLRVGKNSVRIGLYKDEPEAFGLSGSQLFAFDGGTQLVGGSYVPFRSDEGISSISPRTIGSEAPTVRADIGEVIPASLLPTKNFYGFVFANRPWSFVSLTLFFVCTGILFISATLAPWLDAALGKVQIAAGVMLGWTWAGILLRASMLERSEALFFRFQIAPLFLLSFGLAGAALTLALQVGLKEGTLKSIIQNCKHSGKALTLKWAWPLMAGTAITLCFLLRAWQIDYQPPDDDEFASIQASLAIAHKGVPEFQNGVWYTRSPLYHYLAGGVALVSGGNIYGLRLLSAFFACASAALLWKMTRELTHNRCLAFCATLLYAIHPFSVFTGHVARFYQMQEFLHLLGLYFFIRGFIMNSGMRDRYLSVLTFLAAVLSQEITALQILPLTVCYALFGQRRPWRDEIRLLVAVGCALALIGLDYAFFKIDCLTALEGVSPRIEARIGWWFDKSANFLALLIGYSRMHIVLSAFLIPGFWLAWRQQKTLWTSLYLYFFLSILVTNLLITNKGFRYEYYLIPVWILLCIHSIGECTRFLVPGWNRFPIRMALGAGWMTVIVCSWSPWRMLNSYDISIGADPTRALRYVAENLRPGDRIATSEPLPAAALLDAGQSDYDLSIPVLYDFVLRKKGRLIDRNAGAEVIGNMDDLQQAFAKNERLWLVFSREVMHARGENILWQFAGGRIQLYLRENCRLAFRSYRYSVYLWDQNAGRYSSFREKPANWFE